MSSFAGVSFTVTRDQFERHKPVLVTERHIPGGNVNYVDAGGASQPRLRLALYVPSLGAFASLEALEGSSGSLVVGTIGTYTALLADLTQQAIYPGGASECRAEFVLL